MKILIITSSLPPSGGAEQLAWELALSLAKNHSVSVITFADTESVRKINNVEVFSLKNVKHNLWYYMTFGRLKILKLINLINPDVVNSHMHNIITFVLRFYDAKKILTLHNSKFEFYNYNIIQKFKFNLINLKSLNRYEITTVSIHMQDYFTRKFNKNIFQIPNGINSKVFYFDNKIKVVKKSILYVGRLVDFKGVKNILEASKKLYDFHFTFIGAGPLLNSIQSNNVTFLGQKKSSELPYFYNSAFISIFASEYENYPLVGLEAMACGSVVLANKIKGFQEYIENESNGFLADLTTSDLIVESIRKISAYKNINNIKENAFETVAKLDLNNIAEMYVKLYES